MKSLKDKALFRILRLADKAIKNNELAGEEDKASILEAFLTGIEDGQFTPEPFLSTSEEELMRRMNAIIAVGHFVRGARELTPEQLDMIEESALGRKLNVYP